MTDADPQILSPHDTDARQLDLFADALNVERERILSADRRTEIVRTAIEANDAADKRQFEFQMAKLAEEKAFRQEQGVIETKRLTLATWILVVVSIGLAAIGGLVFFMLFFGDERQSALAAEMVSKLLAGLGGFGVIYALITAFRALVSRR